MMKANPGKFTGYNLLRFVQVWEYEEGNESSVKLYDFDYELLTETPETIGWVGGMYLNSRGNVQGFNGGGQFAVRHRNGSLEAYAFMGNDFYFSPERLAEYPDDEAWAKERLKSTLDNKEGQ